MLRMREMERCMVSCIWSRPKWWKAPHSTKRRERTTIITDSRSIQSVLHEIENWFFGATFRGLVEAGCVILNKQKSDGTKDIVNCEMYRSATLATQRGFHLITFFYCVYRNSCKNHLLGHIGRMMFAVMDFHGRCIDVWFQCFVWVWKIG